ncbi:MAG: TonB-dependent receptor [Candidatus Binatia bacterium]|nr:TonB-dependent receptor [Candidatus Binatia bacterium]
MWRRVEVGVLLLVSSVLGGLARVGAVARAEIHERITVRASPLAEGRAHAPTAFVNSVETERYADELESVTDAVADTVGVSVRRYGGLGAFSTLSIRGSGANEVQVYFDGIPLSRAQNEVVNLADLPLDSLERIDIYRGTTPVNFGVAGIGGTVNLIPKKPTDTPYRQATLGYGSFTTRKASGTIVERVGKFQLFGNVAYLGSAGNFRFRSDNDTPFNPLDDRDATRVHNSFDSVSMLWRARREWDTGRWADVLQELFWKENDLPGRGANPSLHAWAGRLRLLQAARGRAAAWPASSIDTEGQVFFVFDRSHFRDPFGELGAGQQNRRDDSWLVGANTTTTVYASYTQTLSAFLEGTREEFVPENTAVRAPREPNAVRWRLAPVFQHQWELWRAAVLLVPTMRVEWVYDRSDGAWQSFGRVIPPLERETRLWSPSIGAEWRLAAGLVLRGNLGRYGRTPNFTELFGNTGSVIGNPELRSEQAWNRDIGFRWQRNFSAHDLSLQSEYAYFNNDVERLIVFVQRSAAIFKPENVGRARLRGHEAGLRLDWRKQLLIDANYTWQEPENRSSVLGGIYLGKRLPGRPQHELYTRVGLSLGPVSPFFEFNYVSGNFLDQANYDAVPARTVHNLGLKCELPYGFRATLQLRNATDNQISDVAGFPLPGRAILATVTWNLSGSRQ